MPVETDDFLTLGPSSDVAEGEVMPYYLDAFRRRVSIARIDGRLYAFDDLCTHEGCPLSAGLLTGTTLMCQCHGSRFDLTDGAVRRGPATEPLGVHEVREVDGHLQVRLHLEQ